MTPIIFFFLAGTLLHKTIGLHVHQKWVSDEINYSVATSLQNMGNNATGGSIFFLNCEYGIFSCGLILRLWFMHDGRLYLVSAREEFDRSFWSSEAWKPTP